MKRVSYLFIALLLIISAQANAWTNRPESSSSRPSFNFNYGVPCVANPCCDWLGVNGGFLKLLIWNINGDELDWGNKQVVTTINTITLEDVTRAQTTYSHDFNYRPGFRLGFNHIFPCMNNDLSLAWTYYWNSNSQSVSAAPGTGTTITALSSPYLISFPASDLSTVTNQTLSSKMSFRLNRVDMTIGQNIEACNGLLINFYGGPVYWGIQENLSVNALFVTAADPVFFQTSQGINTSYRGGGAELGFKLNWNFLYCLVLSANSTIAGTVGKYSLNAPLNLTTMHPFQAFSLSPPLSLKLVLHAYLTGLRALQLLWG